MLYILQTALELGLLYAPVALALFLSYRILDIADLTTDGAFTLGAAVSVTVCIAGHPVLAVPAAMAAGAAAGFVTAFLQTKMGVPSILAGIITNTGLYTINLMAMGWTSTASLLRQDTIFRMFQATGIGGAWSEILLGGVLTVGAALLLVAFLGTRLGLSIRATGDNRDMVRASSINPNFTITVGLCIANANIGTGMVVIGLACLIIGETVLGRGSMLRGALSVFVGSILYRIIYAAALSSRIIEAMKLLTAILVALAIAAPTLKQWAAFQKRKAEMRKGGR